MENQTNDPTVKTPWVWLGEIAARAVTRKGFAHWRGNQPGMIHAGTWDFADEFEMPLKLLIARTEAKLLRALVSQAPIGLGQMLIEKNHEIDRLEFERARRDNPDVR